MKRFFLTTVLVLSVCIASIANPVVSKGPSNTGFGNYQITALDDHLVINGRTCDQYVITYDNSDLKVTVAVDAQKKCRKYYILNEQVPVQYECNGVYFGIKKIDKELLAQGYKTSLDNLNKSEYYHQKVLTSETNGKLDHLNLIASYYPGLFNERNS